MQKCRAVGILGASGLIGLQLTYLLHHHPMVAKVLAFSRRLAGTNLAQAFPAYKHLKTLRFIEPEKKMLQQCDVVFLALPHGESFGYVNALKKSSIPLIDLSSDFRLADPASYLAIYHRPHPMADEIKGFYQCIPEINGSGISPDFRWISLQGCTATAVALALYPLLAEDLIDPAPVIVDAKVSSSGSGRAGYSEAQAHFQRSNGVRAHKLLRQHRHSHEIEAFLHNQTGVSVSVLLNTFSVDMVRGMLCASYVHLRNGADNKRLFTLYRSYYDGQPCIRLIKQHNGFERHPNPKLLLNTNFCDIGFQIDESTGMGVVLSALDNLMKGGAGQAVQCFNLLMGFAADVGLPHMSFFPG